MEQQRVWGRGSGAALQGRRQWRFRLSRTMQARVWARRLRWHDEPFPSNVVQTLALRAKDALHPTGAAALISQQHAHLLPHTLDAFNVSMKQEQILTWFKVDEVEDLPHSVRKVISDTHK